MALQRLELLPVLQADDVVRRDGLLQRNGRLGRFDRRFHGAAPDPHESRMDLVDQGRKVARRNRIVAYIGRDDIRSQLNVVCTSDVVAHLDFVPFRFFRAAQESFLAYIPSSLSEAMLTSSLNRTVLALE